LAEFLTTLEAQIKLEAENAIEQINALIDRVAELNGSIKKMETAGGQASNLRDQRDQCIEKLSELIGVEIQSREYGVVDVNIAGIAIVTGVSATELKVGLDVNNRLGIAAAGAHNYSTSVQGGRLGGLLSLSNELVSDIHDDLNALAKAIIQQVNQYHVQGVGSEGSFGELTGWRMASESLAGLDPPVTDGQIYVRVINTGTGQITRHAIDVDVSTDSLTTMAAKIHAIDGLSASWSTTGGLHIQAETGYRFDFLPAVLPEPTENNLTGSPPAISVSGIYTGTENDTYEFRVVGSGSVGNGDLRLEVRNEAGELVTALNVGEGHAAGDKLDICNGIKISLSTGELVAGETFKIGVFASTDTSGVLAAVGINTFFSGSSAAEMAVCSDIINSPGRIATALGADLTDNVNMLRLAALKDHAMSRLNGMTAREFYHQLTADVGRTISVRQMRRDNTEAMVQNLANRRSEASGVNINDEAAQILIYEQMFHAMAKYMGTVQSSMLTIMEMV
jgi:flagellar hook-associated protein 1 FlgK